MQKLPGETTFFSQSGFNVNALLSFFVDVIGVCKSVEDVTRITTKNSREVSKRNIQLIDMSGKVIQLTMWGNDVRLFA